METNKNRQIDISVIVPIYNEEQIIVELYERLYKTVVQITEYYELIFINDGSLDHSLVELIKLRRTGRTCFLHQF